MKCVLIAIPNVHCCRLIYIVISFHLFRWYLNQFFNYYNILLQVKTNGLVFTKFHCWISIYHACSTIDYGFWKKPITLFTKCNSTIVNSKFYFCQRVLILDYKQDAYCFFFKYHCWYVLMNQARLAHVIIWTMTSQQY